MKFSLRRTVGRGEMYPRGYGFAWCEWANDVAVAYPIPLNWVFRWARDLYWAVARGRRERAIEQAVAAEAKRWREQLDTLRQENAQLRENFVLLSTHLNARDVL